LLINFNDHIIPNKITKFYENLNIEIKQSKHHTIRLGRHFAEKDKISIRTWIDTPYRSKQIILAPDIPLKRVYDIQIGKYVSGELVILLNNKKLNLEIVANNDGLNYTDFIDWFNAIKPGELLEAQILCWNNINY
jgi:hypothetical protein